MRKLLWIAAAVLVAQCCLSAAALAQQTLPPGNSGIDQYTENVPAAGGDRPSHGGGGGGGAGGGGGGAAPTTTLPPQTQARLDRLGKNGAATARAANATGPSAGPTQRTGAGGDVAGSNGFGLWLPLFLALTLLAAAGVFLARWRRHGTPAS